MKKILILILVLMAAFITLTGYMIGENKALQEELDEIQRQQELRQDFTRNLLFRIDSMRKELNELEDFLEQWEVLSVEATAYSHGCGNGDGYTATMTRPVEGRTIAVDPDIIPLGSEVYVEGWGWMIAEDTGGAIKGEIIDIFVDDVRDAWDWGRQEVRVLHEVH